MASGPASRASSQSVTAASARPIGAQIAQQAAWISRRADRIQRAAAWDGNVGNVSPALVDRFSQRVADRVQRSTRAHQVDSFAGGDNLDDKLDMPLVTNEGSITPLSEGGSDETPFEFGSFSPENVQRKVAPQPAEAPAAPPPMSNALRERAELLRRSLAEGTPAPPAVTPSPVASILQPSRAQGATLPAAPRVTMQRAKPVSRVEEMGTGSAPKPAPPAPPTPEPPSQALQRKAQTPSPRPASPSAPVPTVQRAAIPPNVVQGQGRLTQMLNSRFKPKLDTARNPDAPNAPASTNDEFSDSAASISDAPAPRILRSVQPPANVPGVSDDLTPRAPIRRAPAQDDDDAAPPGAAATPARSTASPSPADAPVPTPKARVLRKPATPATPAIQRKSDDRAAVANPAPPAESAPIDAPALSVQPTTPAQDATVPAVQPEGATESTPPSAPANVPAIQREAQLDVSSDTSLPLVAPAAKETSASERASTTPANSDAMPTLQRSAAQATTPSPEAMPGENLEQKPELPAMVLRTPATQASIEAPAASDEISSADAAPMNVAPSSAIQRSVSPTTPATQPAQQTDARTESAQRSNAAEAPDNSANASAPAQPITQSSFDLPDMTLQTPVASQSSDSAPAEVATPPSVQRSAQANAPATPIANAAEAEPAIQRTAVNPPLAGDADATGSFDAEVLMPLVQRTLADEAEGAVDVSDVNATSARTPSPAPSLPSQAGVQSDTGETSAASETMSMIQRAPATRDDVTGDLTLRKPALRETDASSQGSDAPSMPAMKAASPVQRMADAGAPEPVQPPEPSQRVQRSAVTPSRNIERAPAIQRSADGVMVLRAPAVSPALPMPDAPPMPLVQRAIAADATKGDVSRVKVDATPAILMRGLGMSDMPVLRAVTQPANDMAPETRTLSMPIVQRAAVKQEQQSAQAAQAVPVNPFVVAQERVERMPVVQRKPAAQAPDVQRSPDAEARAAGPVAKSDASNVAAPMQNRAISDAELTKAAQRLLPIIKRMLAIERERLFGR